MSIINLIRRYVAKSRITNLCCCPETFTFSSGIFQNCICLFRTKTKLGIFQNSFSCFGPSNLQFLCLLPFFFSPTLFATQFLYHHLAMIDSWIKFSNYSKFWVYNNNKLQNSTRKQISNCYRVYYYYYSKSQIRVTKKKKKKSNYHLSLSPHYSYRIEKSSAR